MLVVERSKMPAVYEIETDASRGQVVNFAKTGLSKIP